MALKIVHREVAGKKDQIRRFLREVEALSRLDHPNVIRLFDFGREEDRAYYTMEIAEGMDLAQWSVAARPSVAAVVEIVAQLAAGLAAAHELGILHRDIKPPNCLVTAAGQAKLLDFGLAKFVDRTTLTNLTRTGQVVGTLPYLSPEQVSGITDEVDVRSDIYSLGVVLYEALTGCFPYPVQGN